jgi:hypothetical protein
MNPPKSILDPTFVYVPAVNTDIRKLFARVRMEQSVDRANERYGLPRELVLMTKRSILERI